MLSSGEMLGLELAELVWLLTLRSPDHGAILKHVFSEGIFILLGERTS